ADVRKAVDTLVASKPIFADMGVAAHTTEQKPAVEKVSFTDFSAAGKLANRDAADANEAEKKVNKKIVIAIVCAAVIIALIAVFF
ncbi:hypothetical protein, partial [Treponema socranskii]|uniref:hypothetical protein n=1 Tax=Treponema socranskii TaxID=53419 RepID=UPI0028E54078